MKAPDAFRTISEVAEELDLPQHVLRFWETRFSQIKPMKRGGGRRYYRREDIDLLRGIRILLYAEGFTIRGVQRLLKDKGVPFVASVGETGWTQTPSATAWDRSPERDLPRSAEETAYLDEDVFAFLPDTTGLPEPAELPPRADMREPVAVSGSAGLSEQAPTPPQAPHRQATTPVGQGEDRSGPAMAAQTRRSLESIVADLEEAQRLLEQVR